MLTSYQKYIYDLELLRRLYVKINAEWSDKWAADFGGQALVLENLLSKDKFYDALKADIFLSIEKSKGLKIAKA
ncbi:MAG: hypothetical protein ACKO96_22910, partial [Flammeovirgaceae bacterium]